MRSLFAFIVICACSVSHAALDLQQSSPSLKWNMISNDAVQVIYPEQMKPESIYIANLVEHYSHVVGLTYGIQKPEQFSLILRPEMAQPNGYVTLAPRRSEWFSSSTYFPYVGSTEWYQTLSIHEYRHVNQFDFYNRQAAKVLYWIMGDMGRQIAVFLALPSWYMEGDAVWTETKYTDAGRGRSPRFLSRLKALVLSDKLPTYDQFLNGSYNTDLPNQYVYGYVLVSYATQKFGDDIWNKVIADVAEFPQPFRLYSSFQTITGQNFQDFYLEAMNDLKNKWAKDASSAQPAEDYRESAAPFKVGSALYYVKRTLDDQTALYKDENGKTTKVAELIYNNEILNLNIAKDKAVYTEYLPDARYGHKSSSRLVVLDLNTGKKQKLTDDLRIYNPSFNEAQNKIIATEFKDNQTWNIVEFDLNGKVLQSFALPEGKVAEAHYLDDGSAVVLLNSKTGYRSVVVVDLKAKKISKTLIPSSRNLITALNVDKNKNVVFEAQYKGGNDIFKINGDGVARCTSSKIGAFTPSSDGENVYFSNMDTYGAKISSVTLASCQKFDSTELVDFKYLGDSPSDNYNKFSPQPFPEQTALFTKNADKYQPEEYGDFDRRLLVPNTWGLWLGRGGGLAVASDNYLRTLSALAQAGTDPEENQSFYGLSFDIKKYYPLFTISAEQRKRKVTDFDTDDKTKWTEKSVGLSMVIPYIKKTGVYDFETALTLGGGYTDTSDYVFNNTGVDLTNYFYKSYAQFAFQWAKDPHARSIMNPWALGYRARYDNAEQPSESKYSGNRTYQQATLQTPAFGKNDGFMVAWDQQKQDDSDSAYRFLPENGVVGSYAFSRGYDYEDVPGYQKVSGNYVFPISYPDWNLSRWYYLRQVYGTVFFDLTVVQDTMLPSTLNSYGAELRFESKFFRLIPLTFGVRVLQRLLDDEVRGDVFFATTLQF